MKDETGVQKKTSVLIMGAGTVGTRIGDVLLSSGLNIHLKFCKYNAQMDKLIPGEFEVKTRELRELCDRYPEKKIEVYAALGPDPEKRVENLRRAGLDCRGSINDMDFSTIALAVDTSNGAEFENFENFYEPNNVPFAFVGGGRTKLQGNLLYAGVPNTWIEVESEAYRKSNVTVVSCNTHCILTAMGKLKEVLGGEQFEGLIRHIDITFCRRHEDPHRGVPKPEFTSLAIKRYHVDEIEALIPETHGRITTTVSKWPTEYFHTLIVDFEFDGAVPNWVLDGYAMALERYERCILTHQEIDHKKTIEIAWALGIRDGDIPFPIYLVNKAGKYKIKVLALTPQRGIVAPSTSDYVVMRTGRTKTWREAFGVINARAKYRGHTFSSIKANLQGNLK
ncbi:MAG: hypothetical protein ACE5G5_02210 [Candidatus Methylomirabilales bacterium]